MLPKCHSILLCVLILFECIMVKGLPLTLLPNLGARAVESFCLKYKVDRSACAHIHSQVNIQMRKQGIIQSRDLFTIDVDFETCLQLSIGVNQEMIWIYFDLADDPLEISHWFCASWNLRNEQCLTLASEVRKEQSAVDHITRFQFSSGLRHCPEAEKRRQLSSDAELSLSSICGQLSIPILSSFSEILVQLLHCAPPAGAVSKRVSKIIVSRSSEVSASEYGSA